ncbi:redox-sensing transcriptional repressor Rex [bacterium]|nr:redox-sensing transcriptional repressor Rex [bacterium]
MNKKSVSRLSHYRKVLLRLNELGFDRIFSDTLGEEAGVTAAQVRKDFSIFGISGNKRGGYIIADLIARLDDILKKRTVTRVIIVGAGNLGKALMHYPGFRRDSIEISAVFDIDPTKISRKADVPVLPLEEVGEFIAAHGIDIAIIAVPDVAAQRVFDILQRAGIRGILNFTTMTFKDNEDVVVNNVYLQFELENLIYFTAEKPA